MGCSNTKQFDYDDSNLDNYYVRVPVSPLVDKKSFMRQLGDLTNHRKVSEGEDRGIQRKWIRSVSIMDTRCLLTTREKFQLMKSWKGITRNLGHTGLNMFVRMFEIHEDIRTYFNITGKKAFVDIRQNDKFMDHVILVMHTLDEAITGLGEVDYVQEMLRGVGRSHKQLQNFHFLIFERIEEPFIFAVKETLGDRFSANMDNIYRKTIKFIVKELAMGFNEPSLCRSSGDR
ncbi:hypothetical protein FSP39_015263 [Pinctada imbricata]|uniref:Globin domain-containing protein n=1 Tax=Pinctada imbricata TaxID=66713 RepID=A0AA88Y0A5_PINIB|nr:hypothetical protein FSP39_015263 [Pinctada imbricata]